MTSIQNGGKMEGSRVSTRIDLYFNKAFEKVPYVSLGAKINKYGLSDVIG